MLDETTYYFTAFAIDQNNNIIDTQTLSITTDFWWHVTPNTVGYRPLSSVTTTNDQTENHYDLSNNWNVQFGNYAGVDCAFINSTARNALSNQNNYWKTFVWSQPRTYSVFIYVISHSNKEAWIISINNNSWNEDRALWIMTNHTVRWYISFNGTPFCYTSAINTWEWYLLNLVFTGTQAKIYLNGVLQETIDNTGATDQLTYFGIWPRYPNNASIYGYVSNVIFEKVARSDDDIMKYKNKMKSIYWIV